MYVCMYLSLCKFLTCLFPADINWGSSTQAFLYSYSMRNLLKLEKLEDHVKNFRSDTWLGLYLSSSFLDCMAVQTSEQI